MVSLPPAQSPLSANCVIAVDLALAARERAPFSAEVVQQVYPEMIPPTARPERTKAMSTSTSVIPARQRDGDRFGINWFKFT